MKFAPLLVLAIVLSGPCAASAWPQEKKVKPDLSLSESRRISPFPPKDARVSIENGRATVWWVKASSEKIVCYEIYRSIDGGPMEKLGRVKEPPFIDHPPANAKVAYAVASIDSNDSESRLRRALPK
jgi:hypothetical protein